MADATKNPNTGDHNGHWTTSATQSGTYEFATGGKYVDRNIDLVIPQAEETVSGTASVTVPVKVGTKSGSNYPFAVNGTASITGTATATVNIKGFTDSASYSGNVSGSAGVSGNMAAIGLSASGSGEATVTTVTVGTKASGAYPITGSATGTGTASASITSTGYGVKGVESGTGSTSVTAKVNSSITAAAATVQSSATVKPNKVTAANGNAKVSATTTSTTVPSSGYYVGVTPATAATTTITQTKTLTTAGYLGTKDEISASGSVTGGNGSKYYVQLQGATETKGTTTVANKVATRGDYTVSEGYFGGDSLEPATFQNNATSGVTYVDISETPDAPVLISGDYLYINQGYVDNLKISLARLVPDLDDYDMAGSGDILAGKTLYDIDGNPVTGTIETKTSANLTASGATVTVPAGYYATQATKSVASGSVNSYAINETTQAGVIASVTDTTPTSGYYPVKVASLTGTVNRTAGYISGTTSTAADSNGGVVGKIAASTTSKTDGTATATANTTHNLVSGTYATSATTGYTYHVDATASASTTAASISASVGYVGTAVSASTAAASSGNKSSKIYIKDGKITNNTSGGTSTATINAGSQIKIAAGYYPNDLWYTAQDAGSAIDHEAITGSLTSSITSGYTAPTLVDTAASGKAYVTLTGNGTMTTGNIFNGTSNGKTQYMEVYTGTYSIT